MPNTVIEDLLADRTKRIARWHGWKRRVGEVRALVANQWATVFPNDVSDIDLPMIANLFQTSVEDGGRLFAQQIPMERVDPENNRDHTRAELREQVVIGYSNLSRIWNQREYIGQDLIAAGLTAVKVWPDMKAPITKRFPRFERLEPEAILPELAWRPDRPSDHVMVTGQDTVSRLAGQFPNEVRELMEDVTKYWDVTRSSYATAGRLDQVKPTPDSLTILDYYSRTEVVRALVWDSPDGRKTFGRILLAFEHGLAGLCPVQLCARKTWTAEPQGQLDGAKGPERTRNRYWRLLTDYFVKMVYGGRLAWNVQNPRDTGPGTVYLALGPDAKMEFVTPEQPAFEVNAVLAGLEDASRTSMVAPRSREGDVDLNKASAAFLSRAQGQLSSVTASLQTSWAETKQTANEVAFAMDEAWCNATKEITGTARGRRFAVSYNPKRDIRGDYGNRVTYGLAAGLDAPTLSVINNQKVAGRMMSRRAAMEMDPTIEDVPAMLQDIRLEALEDSIFEGLLLPTTSLQDRVRIANAIANGATVEEVAELLPPPPGPGGPPAVPGAAGPPGFGPPGVPGAEGPLPPMAELQGAPRMALPAGRR